MYWILLICVIFCIFKFDFCKKVEDRTEWFYFILMFCIAISAFAYHLGTDAPGYQRQFEYEIRTIDNISWTYLNSFPKFQPGFVLFMSLCKSIFDSYYFFKLIYAGILNVTIFYFIKKRTHYIFTAILFYLGFEFFYFNFEIFREGLAVSVFLWSLTYLSAKKYLKYYLFCAIAIFFHSSAMVTLFVPLLQMLNAEKKKTLFITSSIVAFLIIISDSVSPYLSVLLSYSNLYEDRYSHYLENEAYGESSLQWSMLFSYVINIVLPIVMLYIISIKKGKKDYYSFVIIMPVLVVLGQIVPILGRISNYFTFFYLLFFIDIFQYLTEALTNKRKSILFYIFCFMYVTVSFYRHESRYLDDSFQSYQRYYPYASIIEKSVDPKRESRISY